MSSDSTTIKTTRSLGTRCEAAGKLVSRYGLVVVLIWIGSGKFFKTDFRNFIVHSPLLSWLLNIVSVNALGYLLGSTEIVAAILIALRPVLPKVSAAGSTLAVLLFLSTLSFLFTTPGVIATVVAGYPVLSGLPGQFLLKDLVLIGVALWTLGDSILATRSRSGSRNRGYTKDSLAGAFHR